MRSPALPLLAALLTSSCLVPTPPRDTPDRPSAEPESAPDGTPRAERPPAPPKPEPPPPFTPPPPPEGLQGVDVVGHGLRITLYPPFQVSLADDFVAEFVEEDATNGLILSWWNVADPKAGGAAGFGALYNAGVAVHPVLEDAKITRTTLPWPNGGDGVAYRRGESGSYVLLPPELLDSGGMLSVQAGPAEASWAIEVDGERTPLEPSKIVHSADPAKGPGFVLDGRPHKPWGPWSE